MHIRMDGPSRITIDGDEVIVEGESAGEPVTLSWRRPHADQMAADYFDKLVAGQKTPAVLACFVNARVK